MFRPSDILKRKWGRGVIIHGRSEQSAQRPRSPLSPFSPQTPEVSPPLTTSGELSPKSNGTRVCVGYVSAPALPRFGAGENKQRVSLSGVAA